jgi:hypothetical protein
LFTTADILSIVVQRTFTLADVVVEVAEPTVHNSAIGDRGRRPHSAFTSAAISPNLPSRSQAIRQLVTMALDAAETKDKGKKSND